MVDISSGLMLKAPPQIIIFEPRFENTSKCYLGFISCRERKYIEPKIISMSLVLIVATEACSSCYLITFGWKCLTLSFMTMAVVDDS